MIIINKAILHILDFNAGIAVFSEQELELSTDSVVTYLQKHIERAYSGANAKSGTFRSDSYLLKNITEYQQGRLDFVGFSRQIAEKMYEIIAKSDKLESLDLLIGDIAIDDQQFLFILKCNNRIGFIHQVIQNENGVKNEIINHYAILPSVSQKMDEYAFIAQETMHVKFEGKKYNIDGEDVFVMEDKILQCSSQTSPKQTITIVNTVAKEIAEKHGQSSVLAVSKAKSLIAENAEISNILDPIEIGREIFASSPIMQEEYINEVQKAGIIAQVEIDQDFAKRAGKNHKIKTDTGIEITMPVEHFQNKDYVEFINNADGTLTMQIKNIGSISNK